MLVKTQQCKVFYYSKTVINPQSLRGTEKSHRIFFLFSECW